MRYFSIAIFFRILSSNINGFVQGQSNGSKVLQSTSSLSNEITTTKLEKEKAEDIVQKNEMAQRYSSKFITETDIAVRQIKENEWPTLEKRMNQILFMAFKESTTAHLRQNRSLIIMMNLKNESNPFTVKILGTRNIEGLTILNFVSFFNSQPVPSEVIVSDVSFLTLSHLSAILQYPVIDIRAQYEIERTEQSRWWIVGIVLGSGILIIAFGWCCLFVYYNTCGRPIQKYQEASNNIQEIQKDVEAEISKHSKVEGKRWIHTSLKPIKEKNLTKDKVNASSTSVAVSSSSSLPRITDDARDIGEELQKSPSTFHKVKKEKSVEAFPEISLPSLTPVEEEIQHEIKPSDLKTAAGDHEASIERPKSAHANKRISNDFLTAQDYGTSSWSPYQPGDFIAFTYGIQLGLAQYPRPLPSTSTGVIEFGFNEQKTSNSN